MLLLSIIVGVLTDESWGMKDPDRLKRLKSTRLDGNAFLATALRKYQ